MSGDEETARLMGRSFKDGRTWSDEDLKEKYTFGTGEPKWKSGRVPRVPAHVYKVQLGGRDLDTLGNPWEHVTRRTVPTLPDVVIITGNPKLIKNNPQADRFYTSIERYVQKKGYSTERDPGLAFTVPKKSKLWIGHSRGVDRLYFGGKSQQTLAFGIGQNGAINHPRDKSMKIGDTPTRYHYIFTDAMKRAIDKALTL